MSDDRTITHLQIDSIIFRISNNENSINTISRNDLYQLFVEYEITQVISDSDIVLNKDTNQAQNEIETEDYIEYMTFNESVFTETNFIDSINDIIYYLKTPLQKTALFIRNHQYEFFIILAYLIKTKNLKLKDSKDFYY